MSYNKSLHKVRTGSRSDRVETPAHSFVFSNKVRICCGRK